MIDLSWSVSPVTNDSLLFASAAIGGAGAVTLLTNTTSVNGCGYKILFTSAGNSSAQTYTIVGHKMGTAPGVSTSEVVTAPNTTTGLSTNYYDSVTSITASGAMTGNQKIGVSGASIALPCTRIETVQYVGAASAGSVVVNLNTTTGRELLRINTPASATTTDNVLCHGLRIGYGPADCGIVTLTQVTFVTFVCR